eukprot:774894-Amphidinium_carterae.1
MDPCQPDKPRGPHKWGHPQVAGQAFQVHSLVPTELSSNPPRCRQAHVTDQRQRDVKWHSRISKQEMKVPDRTVVPQRIVPQSGT